MDNVAEIEQELEGVTQMHVAAVNGDKALLAKQIVSSTQELDTGDQFGRTPLMFCVLADRLDCAELLLRAGTQVNRSDKGGRTALHWAAHKGNNRLLKLLLSKGADIKQKDNEGQTVLHLCTRHKSTKCMNLLLRQLSPGEIDDQDKKKRTALHWAASYGNVEHVKLLILQDSNIGIPAIEGKTPLHWAASCMDPEAPSCVRLILETTPTVINWPDYEGRTALHLAVADGNESIVKVLISVVNSNISALDNMFRTPLHWAAVLGKKLNTGFRNSERTPLQCAAYGGYVNCMSVLMEHKADPNDQDNEGMTALHWACSKGHLDAVKLLMEYRAFPNHMEFTEERYTPLDYALMGEHHDVAQYMIEQGALSITGIHDIAALKIQVLIFHY
ncbi:inversin-like [Mytilus californianus]|uniref:inversin-like n=1 Tax=Mytilus californianus TaxID=6549 RepID=UPI0022456B86|nr:inversin-like [Mytilus californianus]